MAFIKNRGGQAVHHHPVMNAPCAINNIWSFVIGMKSYEIDSKNEKSEKKKRKI